MPKSSSCQDASFNMQLDLFRSLSDLDLGWPEVKVIEWPFHHKVYESIRLDERKTMMAKSLYLKQRKCYQRKTIAKNEPWKPNIFCLTWPGRSTVDQNRSTRTPLDSEHPNLSFGLCCEASSHSGARWRGGGVPPPRCVFVPWKRRCGRGLNIGWKGTRVSTGINYFIKC